MVSVDFPATAILSVISISITYISVTPAGDPRNAGNLLSLQTCGEFLAASIYANVYVELHIYPARAFAVGIPLTISSTEN